MAVDVANGIFWSIFSRYDEFLSDLNEVVGPDALRLGYLSGSIDLLPSNDRPGNDSRVLREFD